MKSRVLLVAPDAGLRANLARTLMTAGYTVELAEGARRARQVAEAEDVALAIVDADALGEAGPDLVRELASLVGQVLPLRTGPPDPPAEATDPTGAAAQPPEEDILARVRAALDWSATAEIVPESSRLRFGQFTIDLGAHECRNSEGKEVQLTRAEFALLREFTLKAGRVVSRDELSRAMTGRAAEPEDRSVDMLISRLRRKLEPNPKSPELILTVPGAGYKLSAAAPALPVPVPPTATMATAAGDLPASIASTHPAVTLTPRSSGKMKVVLAAGALTLAVAAGVAGLLRLQAPPSGGMIETTPFNLATVPLIDSNARRLLADYPTEPDFKSLALSADGWGMAFGAPDIESAKREALLRCSQRARSAKICRTYAVGSDVVWRAGTLPVPLPADVHAEPLDVPLRADEVPLMDQESRGRIEDDYLKARDHRAVAIAPRRFWWMARQTNKPEMIRLVVERCGDTMQAPCLLLSVDGFLTVRIPKSRRVVDLFMVTTAEMSGQDRQLVGQVFAQKDWRALARSDSGKWYPVANESSESAAVDAAMARCRTSDSGCRLHAISNFRVAEE